MRLSVRLQSGSVPLIALDFRYFWHSRDRIESLDGNRTLYRVVAWTTIGPVLDRLQVFTSRWSSVPIMWLQISSRAEVAHHLERKLGATLKEWKVLYAVRLIVTNQSQIGRDFSHRLPRALYDISGIKL
jgi:hypothetical protein